MKKLFAIATLITGTLFMVSCGDDDGATVAGEVSITGIPASAQVKLGDDLVVSGVTLAAEAGIQSLTVSVDGGTSTDITGDAAGETSVSVDLTFPTTGLSLGTSTLVFTLTDINGTDETVQHALTLSAFGVVEVDDNITADVTWESDNVYILGGRIAVESGATLTIEAGTIIKGKAGTGANATALIIARGASIDAQGTAAAPIIMTSVADEIEPGEIDSPNLSEEVDGLWGGLIVLGNATISVSGDAESSNIEGIPATDSNGLYGGTANNDNSGTIAYISVRHGGSNIGEGNEINGITFGGVGSGTSVSHIEVVANQDDGVEFFGGSVDVTNVIVWANGDDAIDTDQGYIGTIDNGLIIEAGDKAFELDGGEGTDEPAHTITDFTVNLKGSGGSIDVDSDTNVDITGVYFFGMNEDTGAGYDFDNTTSTFTSIEVADMWDDDGTSTATTSGQFADAAFESIVSTATVGATTSVFDSWTFASLRSAY